MRGSASPTAQILRCRARKALPRWRVRALRLFAHGWFLRRDGSPRPLSPLDVLVRKAHGISRIENNSNRRHISDIAVRGAGRDQQKIAGFEHVFTLIGPRRSASGELKRNFVLAKTAVIDSLRIRTMGGFNHDI